MLRCNFLAPGESTVSMNRWTGLLLLAFLSSSMFAGDSTNSKPANPVLIELFTSEGCSSCPPADRLLVQLQQQHVADGAELLLLGEHVDYWNELGWTDRFSSHQFSERQSKYAASFGGSPYTPQMVIDGQAQLVGNNADGVQRAIAQASTRPKPARVSLNWARDNHLAVEVDHAGPSDRLMLAVTEDDLSTNVRSGENGGHVLRHTAVVRNLQEVGTTAGGAYKGTIPVPLDPAWNRAKLHLIVFVQDANTSRIVGAASATP
jgi:hypothetical protein